MEKIRLEIVGMSYSQSQNGAYALILEEKDGKRRLPIIIGGLEAQSIAIELEKIKTPRPLTHDLFKSFAESFGITISEVIINKFNEGVFYAELICSNGKKKLEIDSRTSDAIALALRFGCPVYTYESIMVAASILMEEDQENNKTEEPVLEEELPEETSFSEYSIEDLNQLLKSAIENEDYEKAVHIRDEIKKRK